MHPTVLLIDDHSDVRDGLEVVLRRLGYTVEVAANGREALNRLYTGLRPCMIILDLMMPVMNGFEFRDEQMRNQEFAGIPVIIWSAMPDVRDKAHHLGAQAYVQKPDELEHLLGLVQQHCLK